MTKVQKFSKGQILFLIMAIIVIGLLFYVNIKVFNLFPTPMFVNDIVVFVALGMAVTLTIVFLTIVVRDKRNAICSKEQKSQSIEGVEESERASNPTPLPISSQETIIKTEPKDKNLQAMIPEQKNRLKIKPNKLICPACRREFELPIYLGDLIVNFGPPKPSNIVQQCLYCGAIIALKHKDAIEEDVWKD